MCGRFTQKLTWRQIHDLYNLTAPTVPLNLQPRYNLLDLVREPYGGPYEKRAVNRRCCTARSKSLTSLCRLQSHPAQYVSGIPSAAILLSISHPIRCSTRCLANVRARISGPMIAL